MTESARRAAMAAHPSMHVARDAAVLSLDDARAFSAARDALHAEFPHLPAAAVRRAIAVARYAISAAFGTSDAQPSTPERATLVIGHARQLLDK